MTTRSRCLLVWVAVTATAGSVARWAAAAVGPGATVDQLVTSVSGVALLVCAGWGWLAATVVVGQALRHPARPPRPTRGVPAWVSSAVLGACGIVVVASVPAGASYDVHQGPRGDAQHTATTLDGLPFPDRPIGPSGAARAASADQAVASRSALTAATVVVQPGDSLWRVAEALVGPGVPDREVAAATRALHRLNRAEIGPDPDLIHPGLHLRVPGS